MNESSRLISDVSVGRGDRAGSRLAAVGLPLWPTALVADGEYGACRLDIVAHTPEMVEPFQSELHKSSALYVCQKAGK
jgi:hypothetical protein